MVNGKLYLPIWGNFNAWCYNASRLIRLTRCKFPSSTKSISIRNVMLDADVVWSPYTSATLNCPVGKVESDGFNKAGITEV